MKMSALEYNALPTIRNIRGRIRRACKKQRKLWFLKDSSNKINKDAKVTLIFRDVKGINILKTRRYKGKIRKENKL